MKVYAKNGKIDYSKTTEENLPFLDFLLQTNDLEFEDKFSFEGKIYGFCSLDLDREIAIVEEFYIKEMEDYEYHNTDELTCPYCGYEDSDSWELYDQEDERDCPVCGGVFGYSREVTVSYYSKKVKEPEIKKLMTGT